jgi:hypothetical protein
LKRSTKPVGPMPLDVTQASGLPQDSRNFLFQDIPHGDIFKKKIKKGRMTPLFGEIQKILSEWVLKFVQKGV